MLRKALAIAALFILVPMTVYAGDGCGTCGTAANGCGRGLADWTVTEVEGGFDLAAEIPGCPKRSMNIRTSIADKIKSGCTQAECPNCPFKVEGVTYEVENGDKLLNIKVRSADKSKLDEFKTRFETYKVKKTGQGAGAGCGGCGGGCGK